MNFEEVAETVIERLDRSFEASDDAVLAAVELVVGAWPLLADARPSESWDLFGLDVAAAAEALRIAVGPPLRVEWRGRQFDGVRRAVLRLVRALIDHLTRVDLGAGLPLSAQLEREAAAVQLARALGVVT